jgi:hypothetical protein
MSRKRVKPKKSSAKEDDYLIEIHRSDMSDDMQREAIQAAKDAYQESLQQGNGGQKDFAARIKKRFDSSYPNSTWHCVIGNHFASAVTHQTRFLIFFQFNSQNILLFKTTE